MYGPRRRTPLHTNMKRFLSALLAVVLCAALLCPGTLAAEPDSDTLCIALDPGHGGVDSGAVNTVDGKTYVEADIALKIAYAMKAELETFKNVRVIMTRTDAAGNEYTSESGAVKPRVDFAVERSADLLVSLHLNATDTKNSAKGACVLVTNGNYLPEIANQEYALAQNVLAQLRNLGIPTNNASDGGLLMRNSADRKNPNGTVADYYGIIYYALQEQLPSILIEHCFINNDNECRQFLSSDEKIAAIGTANARSIAAYYGLEKAHLVMTDCDGHWAKADIDAAVDAGWVSGYPDYTFRPNEPVTRAMFVALLARLSGDDMEQYSGSSFSDISPERYYAQNVQWAVEKKIVSGFPDGTFRPDDRITREQMAEIMVNYLASAGFDTTYSSAPGDDTIQDKNRISNWALDSVLFCYESGLLVGRGNQFDPLTGATRAEACSVLLRLHDYDGARIEPELPEVPTDPETPIKPETPEVPAISDAVTPAVAAADTILTEEPVKAGPTE